MNAALVRLGPELLGLQTLISTGIGVRWPLGVVYTHLMRTEDEETINAYLSIVEYQNIEI